MTYPLRLLALFLPFLALALGPAGCSGNEKDSFFNVDHDKDGKLIYEEILFVFPNLTQEQFETHDVDRSGDLSEREYAAFLAGAPALASGDKAGAKPRPGGEAGPIEPRRQAETVEIEVLPAPAEPSKADQKAAKTKTPEAKKAEAPARPAEAANPAAYTVQRGDTLTKIARRFGLGVDDIIKANGNMNPDTLRDGQVLNIPAKP